MTKKDVELVIRILRDTPMTLAARRRIAEAFVNELRLANPRLVRDPSQLVSAIMGQGLYGSGTGDTA